MARLNEPVMSTDSIETLRRKFLRQNREIARINSNQSLRIRELELENARILSENFELRSQILHLEQEIDTGNTHRIADHALDVKAQLEAQLSVFTSLIESLGQEPPRKRHSPHSRRLSKPRPSSKTDEIARKLREERRERESDAAQHEAKLAAIPEHKPQPREPRAILNAEIRALRGEPDFNDSADSPDLGPPPVSRFVEEGPVKASPSPRPSPPSPVPGLDKEIVVKPVTMMPAPRLDFAKATTSRAAKDHTETEPSKKVRPEVEVSGSTAPKPLRAGAKRKYGGEEGDRFSVLRQTDRQGRDNVLVGKVRPLKDAQESRPLKDLSARKQDAIELSMASEAPSLATRRPLTAKSTNDSPRKVIHAAASEISKPLKSVGPTTDENTPQAPSKGIDKAASRSRKSSAPTVHIPAPEPENLAPVLLTTIPEPETHFLDSDELATPSTPDQPARQAARDTPPPAMGEGARPSRRARSAISYAEPNLRDKMRRPTKELLDAVAGEGKFKGRTSIAAPETAVKTSSDEMRSATRSTTSSAKDASSRVQNDAEVLENSLSNVEMAVAQEASRRANAMSPTPGTAKEEPAEDQLPSSVTTQRKRRGSSMAPRESLAPSGVASMDSLLVNATSSAPQPSADRVKEPPPPSGDEVDVYDFSSSSPGAAAAETEELKPAMGRPKSRKSRPSASFQEAGGGSLVADVSGKYGAGGRAKRASMAAAISKLSMLDLEDTPTEESSLEGDALFKDRVSRRRSMML